MIKDIENILDKLKGQIRLPALSNNYIILTKLTDDDFDFDNLVKIIGNHPDIAVRLIALANSAWSAPAKPITHIESACYRLGATVVKSVCIALTVSYHFDPYRCREFELERFWTASLMVADGARLLAAYTTDLEVTKTAQTAGLLHNLGLLWLADSFPKETGAAINMRAENPDLSLGEALTQNIGANYCEAGGWLGQQWLLPEILITALRHHLTPDYQGEHWEMARLVGMAAVMTASIVNNTDYIPDNDAVEKLSLRLPFQHKVQQQLANTLDNKRELVTILFR